MWIMNHRGQNMVEYLLVFAAIIVVLLLALKPDGFLTKSIDESLNLAVQGVNSMAHSIDY